MPKIISPKFNNYESEDKNNYLTIQIEEELLNKEDQKQQPTTDVTFEKDKNNNIDDFLISSVNIQLEEYKIITKN